MPIRTQNTYSELLKFEIFLMRQDPCFFEEFREAIAIPMADLDGRLALDRPEVDVEAAREGFVGGGNHPDDVPGMIWLYRNFRDISFFADSRARWVESDPKIMELAALGEAKVRDLCLPASVDEDVGRREVTVNNLRLTVAEA